MVRKYICMNERNIIVAILGLQITVFFGILSVLGQGGTIFWQEVMYMAVGVVVTAAALVFPRSDHDSE